MKNLSLFITSCALLFSTNLIAGSFLLNEYNLVTIEDVDNQGTLHVDGSSLIGGDIATSQSKEFGQRLSQSDISLELAGTIISGNQLNTFGTTIIADNSEIGTDQNQRTTVGNVTIESGTVIGQDQSDLSATIEENLTSASNEFQALESNSELIPVTTSTNSVSRLVVDDSVSEDEYAVLSISNTETIFTQSPNQELEILSETFNNVAGIIINVSGTDISNFQTLNFGENNYSDVIYNFYEAVTITLSSNVYGSILAPLATLSTTSNIDGSVGVRSIGTGFSAEIHDFITTVSLPDTPDTPETPSGATEVPEPSTWLVFSGIAFVLLRLRKSKKA